MLPQVYAVRVKVAAVENKDNKPAEVDGMFPFPSPHLLTSSYMLREPINHLYNIAHTDFISPLPARGLSGCVVM